MFSEEKLAVSLCVLDCKRSPQALMGKKWKWEQKAEEKRDRQRHSGQRPECKLGRISLGIPGSLPIRGLRIPSSAPSSSALQPGCKDRVLINYSHHKLCFELKEIGGNKKFFFSYGELKGGKKQVKKVFITNLKVWNRRSGSPSSCCTYVREG